MCAHGRFPLPFVLISMNHIFLISYAYLVPVYKGKISFPSSFFVSCSIIRLHRQVPVYEGEIDRVVGVAIAKDALRFAMQPHLHDTMKVSELMEPTYFVPESMRVQVVLEEMRRRRLHMAIVVSNERR